MAHYLNLYLKHCVCSGMFRHVSILPNTDRLWNCNFDLQNIPHGYSCVVLNPKWLLLLPFRLLLFLLMVEGFLGPQHLQASWDFQLHDVTSSNVLWRLVLLQQKGQDRGRWGVHPKGANSMAASGLVCRNNLVGTGRAISVLFGRRWSYVETSDLTL